jgi:predicted DNA-binding transcriptional regulator YafY
VPSSRKYLTIIIEAIRENKVINVTYQSYRKPTSEEFVLKPNCLREHKRRWYLYAHKDDDSEPHMFALDRIQKIEIGEESFKLPNDFNAHDYFSGIYGARVYPDMKRETVVLKVSDRQAKYFQSLPLHYSQEILEETNEYTIFQYYLTTDYDFKQDVLSFGVSVEVLEPKELRQEIGKVVSELYRMYNR